MESFYCAGGENLRYVTKLDDQGKDCQDVDICAELERCYDSMQVAGYQNLFSVSMYYGQNNLYGLSCRNARDCFGCVGLQNKQYCILNQQYTKEEYEVLLPQIVVAMSERGEWGEFFPPAMAQIAYNESAAQQVYPLTRDEAVKYGAPWQESDYTSHHDGEAYMPADDIATYQRSEDERTALLASVIASEGSGKPFRITPQELAFYLAEGIPVPTKHPDDRYAERAAQINPSVLYQRDCRCTGECQAHAGQCQIAFSSTYAPDKPERVFCRTCYDEAVISTVISYKA